MTGAIDSERRLAERKALIGEYLKQTGASATAPELGLRLVLDPASVSAVLLLLEREGLVKSSGRGKDRIFSYRDPDA